MPAQIATATLVRYEKTIEKHERMADKLRATVGGQTDDPEHLLDVLIAAWEEMHREARVVAAAERGWCERILDVDQRDEGDGRLLAALANHASIRLRELPAGALASPRNDQTKEDR